MQNPRFFHMSATISLVILILWLVAWEMFVAPLKPGGSLVVLKAVPLLIPLHGVYKRDIYTLQWSAMMILLYFIEGAVRAWSDTSQMSRLMAIGEAILVSVYFASALLFLSPYKREAKRIAKELLAKVNSTRHER
jgi:uncharacterized membrane protein